MVTVSWTRPSLPNGVITGYKVKVNSGTEVPVSNTSLSYTATGLTPYTVYVVAVKACTQPGCGAVKTITVTTHQAGEFLIL